MSAEKPILIVVTGTSDHEEQAGAFYTSVERSFGEHFETYRFLSLWATRRGDDPQVIDEMTDELDKLADKAVKEQLARGGVLLDGTPVSDRKPSLLGLSVGGTEAFYALVRNPGRYHRAYGVSSRTNTDGIEDLRDKNPSGAP